MINAARPRVRPVISSMVLSDEDMVEELALGDEESAMVEVGPWALQSTPTPTLTEEEEDEGSTGIV